MKQTPQEWRNKLKQSLMELGFTPSTSDPSLFIRQEKNGVFLLMYVDDIILASNDGEGLDAFKKVLLKKLLLKDLAPL